MDTAYTSKIRSRLDMAMREMDFVRSKLTPRQRLTDPYYLKIVSEADALAVDYIWTTEYRLHEWISPFAKAIPQKRKKCYNETSGGSLVTKRRNQTGLGKSSPDPSRPRLKGAGQGTERKGSTLPARRRRP
jgi:hypothetical protein